MPAHGRYPTNVRWREDTGFEMRCEDCKAKGYGNYWWPLTLEFWLPKRSMTRCLACWRQRDRNDERARVRRDPEWKIKKDRAYYQANKDVINKKRAERKRRARGVTGASDAYYDVEVHVDTNITAVD